MYSTYTTSSSLHSTYLGGIVGSERGLYHRRSVVQGNRVEGTVYR